MFHLIKYAFLTKVRNGSTVFWPFVFPIVLGTFMYLAIGQMNDADFEEVKGAYVCGEENKAFELFLEGVKESEIIDVEKMEEEQALEALENREIDGIYAADGEGNIRLTIRGNGYAESIMESVLESYLAGKHTLEQVAMRHPEKMGDAVTRMLESQSAVKQVSLGGKTINGNASFFYALIGMACLYGCFIGVGSVKQMQANLSPLAARRCTASVHRLKVILAEFAVGFFLHSVNLTALLFYMKYVLKLEFTGSYPVMLLTAILGGMFGVSMGIFVGSIGKISEGAKIGIMLGISMTCSFLAGLMAGGMKDIVERKMPFLNRINPAAVIADALYCINVFDSPERLMKDFRILGIMCAGMIVGAFLAVRRERYDSI